jgi:hypothetical protein
MGHQRGFSIDEVSVRGCVFRCCQPLDKPEPSGSFTLLRSGLLAPRPSGRWREGGGGQALCSPEAQEHAELHFVRRPRETDRMAVQQGYFSLSPQVLADHAELLYAATADPDPDGPQFFRFIVGATTEAALPAAPGRDERDGASPIPRRRWIGQDGRGACADQLTFYSGALNDRRHLREEDPCDPAGAESSERRKMIRDPQALQERRDAWRSL